MSENQQSEARLATPAADRPRCAVLTPSGRGAIATIALWGLGSSDVLNACTCKRDGSSLLELPPGRIVLARHGEPSSAEEVVVARVEIDRLEIHCHGGRAAATAIIDSLTQAGAEVVAAEQCTRDHVHDLVAAEAISALAEATTQRSAAILLDQYHGALSDAIREIIATLERRDPQCRATAHNRLAELMDRKEIGQHLTEPWKVTFAGPPNVGKSSLINAILGYDRAIVSPLSGTTRDVLTATTAINGWPVEFADTAGLRESVDAIEQGGHLLAEERIGDSDLVVVVVDHLEENLVWGRKLQKSLSDSLLVQNKIDLWESSQRPQPRGALPLPDCRVSATRGDGLQMLLEIISARFVPDPPAPLAAVPFAVRHELLLTKAAAQLARKDEQGALATLGSFWKSADA